MIRRHCFLKEFRNKNFVALTITTENGQYWFARAANRKWSSSQCLKLMTPLSKSLIIAECVVCVKAESRHLEYCLR